METVLNIGETFTLFKEKHATLQDGSYFESLEDNGGFIMVTYLRHMSQEEKNLMESGRIDTRMIRNGNKILFLIRYGYSPLIFEVSFDPTLYKDKRAMQIVFENHMVIFVGVEQSTNQIMTLRVANFPMDLKMALLTAWSDAFEEEEYSENYTKWVSGLHHYSVVELWDVAEITGEFGGKGKLE